MIMTVVDAREVGPCSSRGQWSDVRASTASIRCRARLYWAWFSGSISIKQPTSLLVRDRGTRGQRTSRGSCSDKRTIIFSRTVGWRILLCVWWSGHGTRRASSAQRRPGSHHGLQPRAEGGGQARQQLHGRLRLGLAVEQRVAQPLTRQHQELRAQNLLVLHLQHHLVGKTDATGVR